MRRNRGEGIGEGGEGVEGGEEGDVKGGKASGALPSSVVVACPEKSRALEMYSGPAEGALEGVLFTGVR